MPVASPKFPFTIRQALGSDSLFRVVVPSGQNGKVIGKGRHRVQKIREYTKATIKIIDPIAIQGHAKDLCTPSQAVISCYKLGADLRGCYCCCSDLLWGCCFTALAALAGTGVLLLLQLLLYMS